MTILRSQGPNRAHASPASAFTFGASQDQNNIGKGTAKSFTFDPDIPLPSVELAEQESRSRSGRISESSSNTRTPIFSVTPPPSQDTPQSPSTRTTSARASSPNTAHIDGIDARLAGIRLTSGLPGSTQAENTGNINGSQSGSQPVSSDNEQHTPSQTPDINHAFSQLGLEGNSRHRNASTSPNGTSLHPSSPSPHASPSRVRRISNSRRRSSSTNELEYNPELEKPSSSTFHKATFQKALATAQNLVTSLVQVLETSSLHAIPESSIYSLHQQAIPLRSFANPSKRTVGLVGDSGTGKSSLINSLLDQQYLARVGNSGAACTCVVTEYCYKDEEGFSIEVEYFSQAEIEEQFLDLFRSYRRFHTPLRTQERNAVEDQETLEEKAKTADDTFKAAFGERWSQCQQDAVTGSEADFTSRLIGWINENIISRTGCVYLHRFSTRESCSAALVKFTSESTNMTAGSTWPFIRKVKVFLKAHILSHGLVLVDLPGLRDLNSARLVITQRYLVKCDEIFAVCNIGRATTDVGVKEVFDLAQKAKLSRVSIICTKSDDIQPQEAEHDWDGTQARLIREKLNELRNLKTEIEALQQDIDDMLPDHEVCEEELQEHQQERMKLIFERDQLANTIENRNFDLKELLVSMRNQKIIGQLLEEYGARTAQRPHVFCVSNQLYWEYRWKPVAKSARWINLSSIPEVRKSCLALVAEGQLLAAQNYVSESIPALLQSLKLWVKSGSGSITAQKKQTIQNALNGAENTLRAIGPDLGAVIGVTDGMLVHFRNNVCVPMGPQFQQWSRAANEKASEWDSWHHAFCRNYGNYSTLKAGSHCWNTEATSAMVEQVKVMWETTLRANRLLQNNYLRQVEDSFSQAIHYVRAACGDDDTMRAFVDSLRHRRKMLQHEVERALHSADSAMRVLEVSALSGIESSIIGKLMEKSYKDCMLDYGAGVDRRRKTVIRSAFGDPHLFENHQDKFRRKYNDILEDLEKELVDAVKRSFTQIKADIGILRSDNAITESESNPALRARITSEVNKTTHELNAIRASMGIPPNDENEDRSLSR